MILDRKKIILPEIQKKILKSGWGNDAITKITLEKITYLSDGLKVKGYLAYPNNTNKYYPCIIWCRGGYGNAGALDDFYAQGILGQLASWGYVVLQSQYRGNDGGEGKDSFGGDDVNDLLNLIPIASELPFANNDIWGIEGWSRGGMMLYLTLIRSRKFKAAVTTGGISDIQCNLSESNFMNNLLNKHDIKVDEEFCISRSILKNISQYPKNTPTLLIHGTKDDRVPPHHSLDLSAAFIENDIEHRLVLFENGDHFLRAHKKEVDILRKNWFKKYLR